MSFQEVADISSYQGDTVAYLQTLRKYAISLMVKLTEGSANGSGYLNPKAKNQVNNGLQVFPTVGVYHYFKGNSQMFGDNDPINEAKWFLQNILNLGLDTNTICAIDVEDSSLMYNTTHDVNLFLKYLNDHGYTHTMVYGPGSWFTSGRIKKDSLYNHAPIWVASYGGYQPGVDNASAWQYTNNGHGLGVDFSYAFNDALIGFN